jgi:hypothetical protein
MSTNPTTDGVDDSALSRWRSDPAAFIETHLVDPETGRPFRCCLPNVSS